MASTPGKQSGVRMRSEFAGWRKPESISTSRLRLTASVIALALAAPAAALAQA